MSVVSQERLLVCHPERPAKAVRAVSASCARRGSSLWLRFVVEIPEAVLKIAGPAAAERTDGLWQTTCFEAFLQPPHQADYVEFNLAPSTQWAAYHFSDYRTGGTDLDLATPPLIALDLGERWFALEAEVPLTWLQPDGPLLMGLSAVIEEVDGTLSYWALAHPPGKPDFHHRDCFVIQLPATG